MHVYVYMYIIILYECSYMCVFMSIYRNLENFHVTKVSWEYHLKRFSFVKQTPYKIILTWIFLDTKFIQNYSLKWPCMNSSVNSAFVITTCIKTYGAPPLVKIS